MDSCITIGQTVLMAVIPSLVFAALFVFMTNKWRATSEKYIEAKMRNIVLSHSVETMRLVREVVKGK